MSFLPVKSVDMTGDQSSFDYSEEEPDSVGVASSLVVDLEDRTNAWVLSGMGDAVSHRSWVGDATEDNQMCQVDGRTRVQRQVIKSVTLRTLSIYRLMLMVPRIVIR